MGQPGEKCAGGMARCRADDTVVATRRPKRSSRDQGREFAPGAKPLARVVLEWPGAVCPDPRLGGGRVAGAEPRRKCTIEVPRAAANHCELDPWGCRNAARQAGRSAAHRQRWRGASRRVRRTACPSCHAGPTGDCSRGSAIEAGLAMDPSTTEWASAGPRRRSAPAPGRTRPQARRPEPTSLS